jgi:hypothetical protein
MVSGPARCKRKNGAQNAVMSSSARSHIIVSIQVWNSVGDYTQRDCCEPAC